MSFAQTPLDTLSIINKINQQVMCIDEDTTLVKKTIDNSIRKKKGIFRRRLVTVSADSLGILNAYYNDDNLVKMTHYLHPEFTGFYFCNDSLIFVEKSCFVILPPPAVSSSQVVDFQSRFISRPCSFERSDFGMYFCRENLFYQKSLSLPSDKHCTGCLNEEELSLIHLKTLLKRCVKRL